MKYVTIASLLGAYSATKISSGQKHTNKPAQALSQTVIKEQMKLAQTKAKIEAKSKAKQEAADPAMFVLTDTSIDEATGMVRGRPELFHNGEWKGVCDDTYEHMGGVPDNVAAVACASTGYAREGAVFQFQQAGPLDDFWFDDVYCNGDEETLLDCARSELGQHNCSSYETVYVLCNELPEVPDPLNFAFMDAEALENGAVRGRPEFYFGGEWRPMCDDNYQADAGAASAGVLCSSLGFSAEGAVFSMSNQGDVSDFWFDDIHCEGGEANILDCPHIFGDSHNCGSHETLYIECNPLIPAGAVRLEEVTTTAEGHVMGRPEYYFEGEWRGVCDDTYPHEEQEASGLVANVICGELGFSNVGATFHYSTDGPSSDFWFDDVYCTGDEASIMDCQHLPLGEHNCGAHETVMVSCAEPQVQGYWRLEDVTLTDDLMGIKGMPQYFWDNEWRSVCDDTYSDEANVAAVLCRSLGLPAEGATFHFSESGPSDEFWFDDVYCNGDEESILDCSHTFGSDNCSSSETVYVTCANPEPPVWHLMDVVHEADGGITGTPEYNHEGVWGSICDDTYNGREGPVASVICRTLGFSGNGAVYHFSNNGAHANFWLDDVYCNGDEENVLDCEHLELGSHNCGSHETVRVTCY